MFYKFGQAKKIIINDATTFDVISVKILKKGFKGRTTDSVIAVVEKRGVVVKPWFQKSKSLTIIEGIR